MDFQTNLEKNGIILKNSITRLIFILPLEKYVVCIKQSVKKLKQKHWDLHDCKIKRKKMEKKLFFNNTLGEKIQCGQFHQSPSNFTHLLP